MGDEKMIVTFCGHANYLSSLEDEMQLLHSLERIVRDKEVNFYFGRYGNFDHFALECAKKYKTRHQNATLVFITPYLDKWLTERKSILETRYDQIIYPAIEHIPNKFAITARNKWMIDQADYVFAYVKTHYGGAYKTLLYAHKHQKPYTNLYQGDYELY
jgi:uncharacterized phage-like protein YoqJ